MGRIRTVKPELLTHEDLFLLEKETGLPIRIAFVGLFTVCDRDGRFKWQPNRIKLAVLPYDEVDFSRVLHALNTRGFIKMYSVGNEIFGLIPTWSKHQVINNRESASELPPPEEDSYISMPSTRERRVNDALPTPLVHAQVEGKGKEMEGNGKGRRAETRGSRLPDDWHPSEEETAFCKAERPDLKPSEVAQRFYDHWIAQPGVKGRKTDWTATWRNWVRNERRAPLSAGSANGDKFRVAHLDHSSSNEAMAASIKRHNITIPADGDIEF